MPATALKGGNDEPVDAVIMQTLGKPYRPQDLALSGMIRLPSPCIMDAMNFDKLREHKGVALGVAAAAAALGVYYLSRKSSGPNKVRRNGRFAGSSLPEGVFDAVIVGAGPSGSTAAYYLAKNGAKVALLDKETFPRGEQSPSFVLSAAGI